MSTLERLKTYLQRCPAEGERVHMEFLIETWNTLPKLLAAVEAGNILELRANRAAEYLRSSGRLSEAARLENALKVYARAAAEL